MKIQSNADEVVITINRNEMDIDGVQRLVKTLRYKELVSKSKATKKQTNEIAEDIKAGIGKRIKQLAKKWK